MKTELVDVSDTRKNLRVEIPADTLEAELTRVTARYGKAARLRGLAESFYGTDDDRGLARLEAGALLAEIRRRHSEFRTAIKGEPDHSRLLDVDAAFRRMIDQLEAISCSGAAVGQRAAK